MELREHDCKFKLQWGKHPWPDGYPPSNGMPMLFNFDNAEDTINCMRMTVDNVNPFDFAWPTGGVLCTELPR